MRAKWEKLMTLAAVVLAWAMAIGAYAQTPYDNARVKADRFFQYKEWGSAAAMCNLLIAERPDNAANYGRAIVAYEMLGDTIRPMVLLEQAMRYGVPLDSLLTGVQKQSFAVGRGTMYEQFMLQAARENQWMERPIDAYLLRYYTFRRNGPQMVAYASKMLRAAPRNTNFLLTLADGYMLDDSPALAADTWRRVLDVEANNLPALLNLANLAQLQGNNQEALDYFRRAYEIKATPYVAEMIHILNHPLHKKK